MEAFPPQENLRLQAATQESQQRATFAASYEDVYRSALTSLAQAQYHVEREDKKNGVVAGMRIVKPAIRNYIAIVIQEKGPKLTEVTVLARGQRGCISHPVVSAMLLSAGSEAEADCRAMSQVHWASMRLGTSAAMDINQVLVFVRNNLVAAGVL